MKFSREEKRGRLRFQRALHNSSQNFIVSTAGHEKEHKCQRLSPFNQYDTAMLWVRVSDLHRNRPQADGLRSRVRYLRGNTKYHTLFDSIQMLFTYYDSNLTLLPIPIAMHYGLDCQHVLVADEIHLQYFADWVSLASWGSPYQLGYKIPSKPYA